MARQELAWTNITREAMGSATKDHFDMVLEAIKELETMLAAEAIAAGVAQEGDTFRFAYRTIKQGSVGMAIDAPAKVQSSGFAGLKRPVDKREQEATNLARYLAERQASGRRF